MNFLSPVQVELFAAQGYAILDEWITGPQLQNLNQEFDNLFNQGHFHKAVTAASVRLDLQKKIDMMRGDWIFWLQDKNPPALETVFSALKLWQNELNQVFYCGINQLEAHLAHYPVGPGYERHLDQAFGKKNRKISFVLYLNQVWPSKNGGELILYCPKTGSILEKVSPLGGRLVLFRSDLFPHEVASSLQARRSLTGWFRSDAL